MTTINLEDKDYALTYNEKDGFQLYTPKFGDDEEVPTTMLFFGALMYGISTESKHLRDLIDEFKSQMDK